MKKIILFFTVVFFVSVLAGVVSAESEPAGPLVSRGTMVISNAPENFEDNEELPTLEKVTYIQPLDELRMYLTTLYTRMFGFPSLLFIEILTLITLLLGAGALTLLVNRKIPDDPNSRLMILYNAIREHPGITLAELQKLTGHSRGSLTVNLHRLDRAAKIWKSVRDGKGRYYIANMPEDEMRGFLRKVAAQEKPQKIFEAIIQTPGISQKELHETTGISRTTLQWHLAQLAKYEAIKSTREKNIVHYSVIPDYILLYTHILEEGKQNQNTTDRQESNNSSGL